jgi:flagellar biosynthetic protein FliO
VAEPAFAFGELLKLIIALTVTIGLFYALALFMKRLQVGTGRSGSLITVLAAQPLGGKEKLWVIDVAGETLVIGTAPGNVNCLHVLKGAARTTDGLSDNATSRTTNINAVNNDATSLSVSAEATPSSFPRMRESSVVDAFSDLLARFQGRSK